MSKNIISKLQAELDKKRAIVESKTPIREIYRLLENDLDEAKIILAAQDIVYKLQKDAEKIGDIAVSDVMPLTDQMREVFGTQKTNQFNSSIDGALSSCIDSIQEAKDIISNAILVLQGKEIESDIENDVIDDIEDDFGDDTETEDEEIIELPPEPQLRKRKTEESRIYKKKV